MTPGSDVEMQHAGPPPRILFHYPVLNMGGAERSTLRMLAALAERGCDVHLVLTVGGGTLEPEVDPRVTIHYLRDGIGTIPGKVRSVSEALQFARGALQWARGRLQEAWRSHRHLGSRFDAAIVGLAGLSPRFVCEVVDARKRFVYVRTNPVADPNMRWVVHIRRFGDRIDGYLCVSEQVRRLLAAASPTIAGKCIRLYNLIGADAMRAKARAGRDPFAAPRDRARVLSVCRLVDASKGLLRMVEVHRRLLDRGVAHEWHILGDGPDRALLERAISERGVAGSFFLHGAIANPFPWYAHADLIAVLSRYEGLCGVVNEARVLERPVIATRFPGIEEQITSGTNGLVVEQDEEAIVSGMHTMLLDADLRSRLASGGYPIELLDDRAKVDALMDLIGSPHPMAGNAG